MNRGRGHGHDHGRGGRGGLGAWGGEEEAVLGPATQCGYGCNLAELQAMWAEMNVMHMAGACVAVDATPIGGAAPVGANNDGGVVQPGVVPQYHLDLRG
jgi:hypothetical protein